MHYLFGSQNINNDSLLSPYSHHSVIIVCDKTEIVFKSASDAVHYLLHNSSGKSDYHCIEFVLDNKFQQHPSCKQQLLQTGFRQLQSLRKKIVLELFVLNFEINIIRI